MATAPLASPTRVTNSRGGSTVLYWVCSQDLMAVLVVPVVAVVTTSTL